MTLAFIIPSKYLSVIPSKFRTVAMFTNIFVRWCFTCYLYQYCYLGYDTFRGGQTDSTVGITHFPKSWYPTVSVHTVTILYCFKRSRAILELHRSAGLHDLGAIKWDMALCLLAVYLICYFSLWKGISTSGKVSGCDIVWKVISNYYHEVPVTKACV